MQKTKIYLGADHAGFEAKAAIKKHLDERGYSTVDLGTDSAERCDYPDYAAAVARAVVAEEGSLGVLICGTGIGMSIAANKIAGCRAARCCTAEDAELARAHNGANVLCLGGRQHEVGELISLTQIFLDTEPQGERHAERRAKITQLEK